MRGHVSSSKCILYFCNVLLNISQHWGIDTLKIYFKKIYRNIRKPLDMENTNQRIRRCPLPWLITVVCIVVNSLDAPVEALPATSSSRFPGNLQLLETLEDINNFLRDHDLAIIGYIPSGNMFEGQREALRVASSDAFLFGKSPRSPPSSSSFPKQDEIETVSLQMGVAQVENEELITKLKHQCQGDLRESAPEDRTPTLILVRLSTEIVGCYDGQFEKDLIQRWAASKGTVNVATFPFKDSSQWRDFMLSWMTGLPRMIAVVSDESEKDLSKYSSALESAALHYSMDKFFMISLASEEDIDCEDLIGKLVGLTTSQMQSDLPILQYITPQVAYFVPVNSEALSNDARTNMYIRYYREKTSPTEDNIAEFMREIQEGALEERFEAVNLPEINILHQLSLKYSQMSEKNLLFRIQRLFYEQLHQTMTKVTNYLKGPMTYFSTLWKQMDQVGNVKEDL